MQWLQDSRQITGDNLKSIRHKATRHFRNKKKEYLKDKMNLQHTVRIRTLGNYTEE
jgi:hypothetical protein